MKIRHLLIIITILLFQLAGCTSIYRSVKEKRDKNYKEGVELYNQNKIEDARDRFMTVVDIEPNYKDSQGYLVKTEKLLKMKAQNIKQRANVNYDKGVALMKRQQYDAALAYLLQAQHEDPYLVDVDDKIKECRKKLEPKLQQSLKLAQWQYDHGQYLQAYATCLKARVYGPSNLNLTLLKNNTEGKLDEKAKKFRIKGKEFYGKKQYPQAQYQFGLALRNYPGDKESKDLLDKVNNRLNLEKYYTNAVAMYNGGNYFGARSSFNMVNSIEPGYKATEQYLSKINAALVVQIPTLYNNGVAFYEKGNYHAAVVEFNKVLSLNPGHAQAQEFRQRAESKLELEKSLKGGSQ